MREKHLQTMKNTYILVLLMNNAYKHL